MVKHLIPIIITQSFLFVQSLERQVITANWHDIMGQWMKWSECITNNMVIMSSKGHEHVCHGKCECTTKKDHNKSRCWNKNRHFNKFKKMNNIIMQMKLQQNVEEWKYIWQMSYCSFFTRKIFYVPWQHEWIK